MFLSFSSFRNKCSRTICIKNKVTEKRTEFVPCLFIYSPTFMGENENVQVTAYLASGYMKWKGWYYCICSPCMVSFFNKKNKNIGDDDTLRWMIKRVSILIIQLLRKFHDIFTQLKFTEIFSSWEGNKIYMYIYMLKPHIYMLRRCLSFSWMRHYNNKYKLKFIII